MKDKLKDIIYNSKNNKHSFNVSQHPAVLKWVMEKTDFLSTDCLFLERIYCVLFDKKPMCMYGNNKVFLKSSNLKKGYSFCGNVTRCKCAKENHSIKISKAKQAMTSEDIDKSNTKRKETCIAKYGTEFNSQSQVIKDKKEETCFKNMDARQIYNMQILKKKLKKRVLANLV